MPFTFTKDTEYKNCYFDISETDKRLISVLLKNYKKTGKFVFLKMFKKAAVEYQFEHSISLVALKKLGSLVNTADKNLDSEKFSKDASTKPLPAKIENPAKKCRQRRLRQCFSALLTI